MRWPLVLAVGLAGCARVVPPEDPTSLAGRDIGAREPGSAADRGSSDSVWFGRATFYSDRFAGRKTASGERYDPQLYTAAHRTLPLGTVVDVTRRDGRTVRVRINDRGPFGHSERIIDLSKRAAKALGMLRAGVVDVTLRVVD